MRTRCPYCDSFATYLYVDYSKLVSMYRDHVTLRFKSRCVNCSRDFYFDRGFQGRGLLGVWKSEELEQEVDE